jgi:arginyl-tRNA synthetase
MKIPAEFLKESNYEGTRFIEIKNETVTKLIKEISDYQKEANPTLEIMDKYAKILDPYYQKIQKLQGEIGKIKEEMAEDKAKYDEELAKVEKIDAKAQMIKNKLMPIVLDEVKEQLGEFEVALQTKEKDGKIFVEVQDKIEETVKTLRLQKAKAKK